MSVAKIEGAIDPLGPSGEIDRHCIQLLSGEDIPLRLCPEGCPVPATVGDSSFETQVTVTIWVADAEHSERVRVEM